MKVSACVPCYNNESTLEEAATSLKEQTVAIDELLIVDDASTDGSAAKARALGARVVAMERNAGRGAVRAACIEQASGDLVLSVDATAVLAPDFLEKCLPWFDDPKVSAVYGRIMQREPKSTVDRWRGRHLYRTDTPEEPREVESLITGGVLLRKDAVLEAGNFDPTLRQSEDEELGHRLRQKGWKIVYEPRAVVTTIVSNNWRQVMERYWRWNVGVSPRFKFRDYARVTWYALKVMVAEDLKAKDLRSALVSAFIPHYCAYRTLRRK